MELIGVVQSEGGPLLVADQEDASEWNGVFGRSTHYDSACNLLDSQPSTEGLIFTYDRQQGLLWEMRGAGAAYVYRDSGDVVVIRSWLEDTASYDAIIRLANSPPAPDLHSIGVLYIKSEHMVIMWATEDASSLHFKPGQLRPDGELSVDDSVISVQILNGQYEAWHDSPRGSIGNARRLRLVRT